MVWVIGFVTFSTAVTRFVWDSANLLCLSATCDSSLSKECDVKWRELASHLIKDKRHAVFTQHHLKRTSLFCCSSFKYLCIAHALSDFYRKRKTVAKETVTVTYSLLLLYGRKMDISFHIIFSSEILWNSIKSIRQLIQLNQAADASDQIYYNSKQVKEIQEN